jgi:hypothetical protein
MRLNIRLLCFCVSDSGVGPVSQLKYKKTECSELKRMIARLHPGELLAGVLAIPGNAKGY